MAKMTKITTDQKSFQQVAIAQKFEILRTNLRRGQKFKIQPIRFLYIVKTTQLMVNFG
jgi:hypothetical protein